MNLSLINLNDDILTYTPDYSIPLVIALNLNDSVIISDITLNNLPPDNHLSWNCWKRYNEDDFKGLWGQTLGQSLDLPSDDPDEASASPCPSCND